MSASGTVRADASRMEMDRLIPLVPSEIHVWLAYYDEITGDSLHCAYRELLNAAEREQEQKFYFERDQRRYLITRALVRTVLSRYVAVPPKEWIFCTNAYGRPDIVNNQAKNAGVTFNISHTNGLIVLGVTSRRALGVDVENIRAREALIDIANRHFASQEVAALTAVPPNEQQYRFFEYWTFKEAYIKARGMGLSLPLDKFRFHYPDDHKVEISIHPELADNSARWQFWQFLTASEYLVAICAERVGLQSPSLVLREAVPMRSEKKCVLEFTRISI